MDDAGKSASDGWATVNGGRVTLYVPQTLLSHSGIRRRAEASIRSWETVGVGGELLVTPGAARDLSAAAAFRQHVSSDRRAAQEAYARVAAGTTDHVIARLFLPTPAWLRVAATGHLSLEVHNAIWQAESRRDLPRVLLGGPTAQLLVRRSYAGFFVTNELKNRSEFRRLRRRLVLGNGIELGQPTPAPQNSRPRVGMVVGGPAAWHGLDRFAAWAHAIPQADFVVVCPARTAAGLGVEWGNNLSLEATTSDSHYRRVLATLDAAAGSLAPQRKNVREGAPLKVRDYIDAGIPTTLLHQDTNLMGVSDPCLLRLDSWAETARIARWLATVRGKRVLPRTRDAVSIRIIERARLNALFPARIAEAQ